MKKFEEWWKVNNYGENHTPGPKDVWKAALEWVIKASEYQNKTTDLIRRELEDKE